jgi:hypothetical protein
MRAAAIYRADQQYLIVGSRLIDAIFAAHRVRVQYARHTFVILINNQSYHARRDRRRAAADVAKVLIGPCGYQTRFTVSAAMNEKYRRKHPLLIFKEHLF